MEMRQSGASFDLSMKTSPTKKAGVMAQEVLEDMVLYDGNTEMGYSLNASARYIWELCDGNRTLDMICGVISKELDIEAELLQDDVKSAVSELVALGLLNLGTGADEQSGTPEGTTDTGSDNEDQSAD